MSVDAAKVEAVLATCHAAAEANRATRGRRGNVVYLTPDLADDVVLTGDLHGNRLNFQRLLAAANLEAQPLRHLVMHEVCHGGPLYPSGTGCMSHLMLEDVMALKVKYGHRFHFLLSNHELAEVTDYAITKGRRMLNVLFRCGLYELYGDNDERVRQAYVEFLRSCPLAVKTESGVFVSHSLPARLTTEAFDAGIFDRHLETADFLDRGSVFRLVWGRDFSAENSQRFAELVNARVLVHGHEPQVEGFSAPNERTIILDSCHRAACYLTVPVAGEASHAELLAQVRHV